MEAVKFTLSGRNAFLRNQKLMPIIILHIVTYIRLLC